MKNEKILKKVIEKAIKYGYKDISVEPMKISLDDIRTVMMASKGYYGCIFSHDFCKAFFGTKILDIRKLGFTPITKETKTVAWKFHLLAMVLKKDPISYLSKFL